jgi:hypothetical protein
VVGAALAAGTGVADIARQATETILEQAGAAGQAAGEFTDRMLSSVAGQKRSDEPKGGQGGGQGQGSGGQG